MFRPRDTTGNSDERYRRQTYHGMTKSGGTLWYGDSHTAVASPVYMYMLTNCQMFLQLSDATTFGHTLANNPQWLLRLNV